MPAHLQQPQLFLDYLLPPGREKFRLEEVAELLSADDGRPPVSVKAIRNAMAEGRLFGNRIPLAAPLGEEQRIRLEFMTRSDVLQALLITRTWPPHAQIDEVAKIVAAWPAEALDELLRLLTAMRARKALR